MTKSAIAFTHNNKPGKSKYFLWLFAMVFFVNTQFCSATIFTSVLSGPLSTASTWDLNTVPTNMDTIIIASTYTVTLSGATALSGVIINSGGVLDNQGNTLTFFSSGGSDWLFVDGEYTGTGTTILNNFLNSSGAGIISTTGSWTISGQFNVLAGSNLTVTSSDFNITAGLGNSGIIVFTSGNLNLSGGRNIANNSGSIMTLTNGSITGTGANSRVFNSGELTVGGNVSTNANGKLYNYANSILNIKGVLLSGGGILYNYSGSTVNYIGSGGQTIKRSTLAAGAGGLPTDTYYHLKCSNNGIKTLSGNIIVKGDLTIRDAAQLDASATPYNIDLKGHWYDSSNVADPFVERTGTVAFSDTGAQTISEGPVAETFYNLTISNGGIKSLNTDIIINGDLTIQDTAQLDVTATPHNISLGGSWINAGTKADPFLERTGRVTFNGAFSQTITSNTVPAGETFYDLTVSNTSGDISLSSGVTVDATLNFTTGKIILGTNNLILSTPTAITGSGSSGYVVTDNTGYLQINDITSAFWFPVGISTSSYTPTNINNNGSGATATDFSVRVADTVLSFQGNVQVDNIVDRTWYITSTGGTANVTLTLQWNAADELGAFNRTNCGISHYSEPSWDVPPVFSAAGGIDPYTQTRTGISTFSPFAVEGLSHPLPIELLSFTGELNPEGQVLLSWTTATETNNDYYTVERASPSTPSVLRTSPPNGGEAVGLIFIPIGIVKGAGNSTRSLNYNLLDESPSPSERAGVRYYRLKQTDYDGKFSYSDIIAVVPKENSSAVFSLYPNPGTGIFTVKAENPESDLEIQIYNSLGMPVYKGIISELIQSKLDLSILPKGIYLYTVQGNNCSQTGKLVLRDY